MRVWTQQNLEFWEELERDGIAYCKQESWLYKEYDFAYDWLVGQMHIRLSTPPKVEIKLPLWCWVQYKNYKSRKPRFSPSRDDGGYHAEVMIEADIPDELLLQSNFYLWSYCCMNGWLIGDETLEKELDVYEKTNGIEYGYKFQELPKEYQERIKKSWENIFNLDYRHRRWHDCPRRNKPIQATFWLLRKEWVKDVKFFIPK